jgi:hypothetical protein
MLPRRRRDMLVENPTMEDEIRRLCTRLDTMETSQRRAHDDGEISEAESEEIEVEGYAREDVAEECLLKSIVKMGARAKMEVPMYEGNLEFEELLDWIRDLEKYLDYEEIKDEKKVKHAVMRLKGHATVWWDELHPDRRRKGKQQIKSWDRMLAKLKAKFIPKDYHINMFRRLQSMK